jgi:ADP-heptose:LPS heptosyltransferase
LFLRQVKQQCGSLVYAVGGALWRALNPNPPEPTEVKELLIINLLRIGDTVVTLPTLEALRKLYPDAKISLVVRSLVASLFENQDMVDELIVHEGDNSKSSCQKLISRLPAADLSVILDTSPWVSWAARKAGCKKILAYNSLNRAFAATHRLEAPPMWNVALPDYQKDWQVPYQGQAWFQLAVFLGAPEEEVIPTLSLSHKSIQFARDWLEENKIKGKFVLCHPGSSRSYLWPEEKFKELISRFDCPVVIGGGPDEIELCQRLASASDAVVFCEAKELSEYAALICLANYVVSVDTSAAHLAAALKVPVSVLFGPGDPQIWAPRGENEVKVLVADTPCLGCKAATCRLSFHECMEKLSLEQVLATLPESLLK